MPRYKLDVVGESHYQKDIKKCREGDPVILMEEPDNPYDKEAICVMCNGKRLGYIAKIDHEWLNKKLNGKKPSEILAWIEFLKGGTPDKPFVGVEVAINTTAKLVD